MSDDLLARADRAVRESYVIQGHACEQRRRARINSARFHNTLQWIYRFERSDRQLGLALADRIAAAQENPAVNGVSPTSDGS